MSQTPRFVIINDAGLAVRVRLNEIFEALQSSNAGPTAPQDTAPGMLWFDTSTHPPRLMIRNISDDAFQELLDGGTY
jgi:hypothetical protein